MLTAGCSSFYELPIETPIRPKLDVSAFQRVLVAGFLAGGTQDVDTNLETVRLLRSQLRNKSDLRVIDADMPPLIEVSLQQRPANGDAGDNATTTEGTADQNEDSNAITEEKDLEPHEHIFADIE
jgi:hypothetical protein